MWRGFPLFPEQASTVAAGIDSLYFYLIAISVFFSVLIFSVVIFFAVKYHRRSEDETPELIHGSSALEIFWTLVPLGIVMTIFAWGTALYFQNMRPPADAIEMFVVGKQWMWKIQHPEGKREINELHIPVGQAVKLTMTSEDVIHSFFVPAFRTKMDVLPGRYTQTWFQATKTGEYHLFCAEYCGTSHSGMIGKVIVMEPAEYERWLGGETAGGESMSAKGEALYRKFNCQSCHGDVSRAPALQGLFGKAVELENGQSVQADEAYLRESVLVPAAKTVKGYAALMPSYTGQISEEQVLQLTAYLKSLGAAPENDKKETL